MEGKSKTDILDRIVQTFGFDTMTWKNHNLYRTLLEHRNERLDARTREAINDLALLECQVPRFQPRPLSIYGYGFPIVVMSSVFNDLIKHNSVLMTLCDHPDKELPQGPFHNIKELAQEAQFKLVSYILTFYENNAYSKEYVEANNFFTGSLLGQNFFGGQINQFIGAYHGLNRPEDELSSKYLAQLLFIMLHELGHYVLMHAPAPDSSDSTATSEIAPDVGKKYSQDEYEADLYAVAIIQEHYHSDFKISDALEVFTLLSYLDDFNDRSASPYPNSKSRFYNIQRFLKGRIGADEERGLQRIFNHFEHWSRHVTAASVLRSSQNRQNIFNALMRNLSQE